MIYHNGNGNCPRTKACAMTSPLRMANTDHSGAVPILDLKPVPRRPRPRARPAASTRRPPGPSSMPAGSQTAVLVGVVAEDDADTASLAGSANRCTFDYALRLSANVYISDYLPNGPHLKVNNAIELRAGDTQLVSSRAETALNASESCLTPFDWQLGYLNGDALCHRPAMLCYRFVMARQPSSSRCQLVAGAWSRRSGDRFTVTFRGVSKVTRSTRICRSRN
jgi:hypothetical protein